MPNPFYQCYLAGTLAADCEPVFMPSRKEKGFLPELDALTEELLQRTVVFFICSPSNPEGAVASKAYLEKAITLARQYDFMLFVDECYSEIYFSDPPTGALEVAWGMDKSFRNMVVFNSLSKRSNLPGLRSGFVVGDETFISDYGRFRNVACPQMPLPVQAVSMAVWSDEEHVIENRRLYREKFLLVEELMNSKFFIDIPAGGFFLWLNCSEFGGGIRFTERIWKEVGVKMLPGAYLAKQDETGVNPAENYIRIALVQDLETTREAIERISKVLS